MTKYLLKGGFSVPMPSNVTQEEWDRIFKKGHPYPWERKADTPYIKDKTEMKGLGEQGKP